MIVTESVFLFVNLILVIFKMLKNYILICLNFQNQRYPVLKYELIEKWLDFRDDYVGLLCPLFDKYGLCVYICPCIKNTREGIKYRKRMKRLERLNKEKAA